MLLLSSLSAISDTFENVNMHTLTLSFQGRSAGLLRRRGQSRNLLRHPEMWRFLISKTNTAPIAHSEYVCIQLSLSLYNMKQPKL